MALAHVNSATNGAASGTAITCTAPAGIAAGDILVAVFNNNNAITVTDNNGATPFTQALARRSYNTDSAGYTIWYRVAGGSEPATYAFTGSGSDRWTIIISAYRGGNTSTIWDVAPSATTEGLDSASPYATNSLTTGIDGAMIIALAFGDTATGTFDGTPADSFTSRQNNSGEELIALADKLFGAAGTQASVSWNSPAGIGTVATQIFSIAPATAATNTGNFFLFF